MKVYDAMFAAAVGVTVVGVAVALLRSSDDPPPRIAIVQPPPMDAPPLPPEPEPMGPPSTPESQPVAAEELPPPPPDIPPPTTQQPTPQQMILGSWTLVAGGPSMTLTFHEDGALDMDSPDMPAQVQFDAAYAWDGDDRLSISITFTTPDGEMTRTESTSILALTDTELVLMNDRTGAEQRFTR